MFASGANDSEDLLINCSSTRTTPAITSAWALVRESASPWSTSSLSMRSRFINDTLTQSERCQQRDRGGNGFATLTSPSLRPGFRHSASHALQHCAGSVANVQLRRAITAQPDHNSRRVYPEKGGNLSSHLDRFSALH